MERFGALLDDDLFPVADIDAPFGGTTIEFHAFKSEPVAIVNSIKILSFADTRSDWLNDEYLFHHHTICSLGVAYCKMEGMLCVVAEA